MGVSIKTTYDNLYKTEKACRMLNGKKINVGILGEKDGELAYLAGIHEYGCLIKVTPAMRGYLASQGLHLKKTTKEIVIPERSFIRAGFDQNHMQILKEADEQIGLMLDGIISLDNFFKNVGGALANAIKEYATDLNSPANHPFTIKRKNSSNPLVGGSDAGMIDSICYEVEV